MSARDLTPEQEATIDQRMGQAFDFLRDVLADPTILDDIPGGATLRFSEVTIGETTFHLTAFPDEGAEFFSPRWTARVTAPAEWAAAGRAPVGHPLNGAGGKWGSPPTHPETGRTAEDALRNLEHKLHDARHQFEGAADRRSA